MAKVFWTEEEITTLGSIVHTMRMNQPEPSLVTLINKAQAQLPKDRRRKINSTTQVKPLLEEIEAISANQKSDLLGLQSMQDRLSALEKSLEEKKMPPIEEVVNHFGAERLAQMLPPKDLLYVAIQAMVQPKQPQAAEPGLIDVNKIVPQKPKLKKFVVIGPRANQGRSIKEHVGRKAEVITLERGRADIPHGDKYIIWANFVGKPIRDAIAGSVGVHNIHLHHGGVAGIIDWINKNA